MKRGLAIVALVSVMIFLAGCPPQPAPEAPVVAEEPVVVEEVPEEPVTVNLLSAPATAEIDQTFTVRWSVGGPTKTIPHTAVHYDSVSHPGTFGLDVLPPASGYPELTPDFASGEFDIPREFTVTVTPTQSGTLYYRLHAIVDGDNYWTEEMTITVQEAAPQVKEFTLGADDRGFYPSGAITVNKGDTVKMTFNVRKGTTYFGGLDFRAPAWGDTGKIKPGASTTVEFTASESFLFKSYWPGSNRLKATGQVIVS